jgi:FMN phosphatase YigB (HAD superfamily)
MAKTLIIDFSRVLLFSYADTDSLNALHSQLSRQDPAYDILDHFYLNQELFDFLAKARSDVRICLFSDGALHLISPIRGSVEAVVDTVVTAEQLGHKKTDPEAYRKLLKLLDIPAKDAVFLDDKQSNVEAAKSVGIQVVHFENNTLSIPALSRLIASA